MNMGGRAPMAQCLAVLAVLAVVPGLGNTSFAPAPGAVALVGAPAVAPLAISATPGSSTATTGNWSGYVATPASGSVSAVQGTFKIPWVRHAGAGSTVSQWVGVGGWDGATLVQAGVNVVAESRGTTLVEPWWEIVPGPQHLATGVMTRPGDTVTVELSQVATATWSISLTDVPKQETFSTVQAYDGTLSSAEWVVEADTTSTGRLTRLAPFTPAVNFSALSLGEGPCELTRVVMVQGGKQVSVPSGMTPDGFAVSYGATPPAPAPA
jgi:hypothetical protein